MSGGESDDVVHRRELAEVLKVSVGTVDNWRKAGVIPFTKPDGKRSVLFSVRKVKKALGLMDDDDRSEA